MRRALVVLVALVPLAACGGDDSLSKEEYVEQGDAICERFEDDGSDLTAPATLEEVPAYIQEAIDVAQRTVDEFGELDPPGDAEDVHAAFLAGLEDGIAALEDAKTAAEGGVQQGVIDGLSAAGTAVEEAGREARSYGFRVCGAAPDARDATTTTTSAP